jgi:ParB family transcriptional regulator, chromosome partitioning protein
MTEGAGPRAKRPPLGRGLAALFGEAGARISGDPGGARPAGTQILPIEAIRPSPLQPRRQFPEAELDGLAQSIREKGIVQPLLVRPIVDAGADFELVAGERRWRAAQRVGLHEVPAVIRELGDAEALEIALVENLQREDLSPLDEAQAYGRLAREFGRSQASLAAAVGKSRSHVANTLRLLSLPAAVRESLEKGLLSAGHARALLAAPDPVALAAEIVRRGLNVRATEELARRRANRPKRAAPKPRGLDTPLLERDLAAALGLRVAITAKRRGGALTVYFETLEQLDQVVGLLMRERKM